MIKPSLFKIIIILMLFCAGLISHTAAQGIRNEGATISIASGYVVCQGGLVNSSGTITNDGTLTVTGVITNPVSATIEGDGNYYVGGDWTNNGTFTPGTSTVTFSGTEPQTIVGPYLTTFNNLVIGASSAGTTIPAGARVTVEGSTFSPNGKLTINSDAVDNSGSLIYSGSGTPTGNITYNRLMPAGSEGSLYRYISSPVHATSLPSDQTYWLYDEPTGEWVETTSCTDGLGYTMAAKGGTVSYTGTIVTSADRIGTAPYSITSKYELNRDLWGGGGWNLLGNPFTSAMSATTFISVNGASGNGSLDPNYQAVYIYNGSDYYYIASAVPGYNGVGTFPTYTDIQAGQGFFVLANYNNVPFNIINTMQTHNTAVPMTKSAMAEEKPWPGLQLRVKFGEKESSTLLVFNENMTTGLDPGYDVGQLSTGPDVEIYTALVEKDNSVNFSRQALPVEGYEKSIIPVGIDSEKGGEVAFSAYTVPLEDKKFWLEDRVTGIFTDLNNNTYTVTLPAKTYGTGRFFIIASANTPTGMEKPQVDETGIRVWTSNDQLIIKGEVSGEAICSVYDMRGQKIVETQLNDGELNTVTLSSGLHGVYLVRVVDGMKVTTRKIALL